MPDLVNEGEKSLQTLIEDASSIVTAMIAYEDADARKLAFAVNHLARVLERVVVFGEAADRVRVWDTEEKARAPHTCSPPEVLSLNRPLTPPWECGECHREWAFVAWPGSCFGRWLETRGPSSNAPA